MADERLPQVFGRYVLRERVGSGGMAEVFRAQMPGLGGFEKSVAIKRMFREYGQDGRFVEMLTDEAKIVSLLSHPNIVQILDVGQIDGDYYIAFEFVEGVDLFRVLQRHHEVGADLPLGMACYVVAELCAALDYAHARKGSNGTSLGIVHRDVSPQNVLLSLVGEVKLTDFGIAKAAYRFGNTQAGTVKGKIYYMSPEQALGHPIDHRSDLFSAGIVLYEALCTRPLYDEPDANLLFDRVTHGRYEWPADKGARIPAPLQAIVERALQPHPAHRFQTGRALRDALLKTARDLGLTCDREQFGAYLRRMYAVEEQLPPPAPVPTRIPGSDDRWRSQVAPMPVEPTDLPPPVPPMPRTTRPVVPATRPSASRTPLPANLPPPVPHLDDSDDPPTLRPRTDPNASIRPARPSATGLPQVTSPARSTTPRPANPAPRTTVPRPLTPQPAAVAAPRNRLPTGENDAFLQPTSPNKPPRRPSGAIALPPSDEATSMLEAADMDRRLAEARASRPATPDPNRPNSQVATRAEDHLANDIEGTTRPARSRTAPADVPLAPAAMRGGDDESASWPLIALTALVWTGVVVLGVYATLLSLSH
ncbi:MAG: protein kinase domain-containing protein [Myxococcota bacterium]